MSKRYLSNGCKMFFGVNDRRFGLGYNIKDLILISFNSIQHT